MSKMYTSKKAGYSVLSGTIKSIADDRMSMVVSYREYDPQKKKAEIKDKNVVSPMQPIDASYKEKDSVTILGGILGQDFQIQRITNKSAVFEVPQLSVVSGYIEKVRYADEKDENGNPKLKVNGQPKKPHFDIFVTVEEEDKVVHHIMKIYDSIKFHKEGEPTNIEKYQAKFADRTLADGTFLQGFKSPDETPIRVTIATQPGTSFAYQGDESVYYGCNHLGISSIDLDFQYQRTIKKENNLQNGQQAPSNGQAQQQNAQPTAQQAQPQTNTQPAPPQQNQQPTRMTPAQQNTSQIAEPAPQNTQPATQQAATPAQTAPAQTGELEINGFDEDLELDFQ